MIECRRGRRWSAGVFSVALLFFAVLAAALPLSPARGQEDAAPPAGANEEDTLSVSAMIPSVTLWHQVAAGVDSIHVWSKLNRDLPLDRARLLSSVRGLLRQNSRFEERLTRTYPRQQIEWLLVTDAVADTLTVAVGPLLERYSKAHPEEILTEGRIALETEMAQITGPPSKLLGLHFVRMANYILARSDSLVAAGRTKDMTGLQDGVLRYMADWYNLYDQVHKTAMGVFECRVVQEDWIMARLKDKCGNSGSGVWTLSGQWMAQIPDSTTVPVTFRWAHEFKIHSAKCPEDIRSVYIDLPNYRDVQKEIRRREENGTLGAQPSSKTP
jgi:hypothetical protein